MSGLGERARNVCPRPPQLDLRFSTKDHEALFKSTLQKRLHVAGLACNSLIAVGFLVGGDLFDEDAMLGFSENSPRTFRSWTGFVLFLFPTVVSFFLLLSRHCHCLKGLNWEIILTIVFSVICVAVPLNGGWVAARLYGEDPSFVWVKDMRGSEGNVILVIDGLSTGICLFVPIRMVLKWIPCVAGVTSFIFCATVFGSPFPQMLVSNCFILAALVVVALWGAWVNEVEVRKKFVAEGLVRRTSRELEIQVGAQQALIAEKTAFEMLISMMCDATVWLSEDGNTVLKCDERFEMLVGTSMKGKMLDSCFTEAELKRVISALKTASDIPVLVPTTICAISGESQISIDCLIVRQPAEEKTISGNSIAKTQSERAAFLMGVRITGHAADAPESNFPGYDKMQVLDMINDEATGDKVDKAEERSVMCHSQIESVETTSTGLVFKNISAKAADAAVGDELEGNARFAEISKLGRREGWLVEATDVSLRPKEILGSGSFGIVVAASLHGTRVAVKVPKRLDDRLLANHLLVVANELRILRHVRHPNIVLFFGAYVDAGSTEICLIFEHIIGTHLADYVQHLQEGVQIYIRWRLILDVACALRYLHALQPRIVHGDLKADNIVVEAHGLRAKLLDFGLARVVTKGAREMGGSLRWMAPEVILIPKVRPRASADVFSFGRVVYMVFSGRRPLENFKREAVFEMAKARQTMPLLWPDNMPLKQSCFDFCEKTSFFDQKSRPTMQQVHTEISGWKHAEFETRPAGNAAHFPLSRDIPPNGDIPPSGDGIFQARESMPPGAERKSETGLTSSQTSTSATTSLALPNRQPTQRTSKKLMLTMQATQWNFPIPRGCCCLWHAALRDMYSVVHELWDRPCNAAFLPHTQWQCRNCGVVDLENRCSICGDQSSMQSSMSMLASIDEEPPSYHRRSRKLSL